VSDISLDEVSDELDVVLEVIPEWRLPPGDWRAVQGQLQAARGLLQHGDADGVHQILIELERLDVARLGSLAGTEADEGESAPEPVIQLIIEIRTVNPSAREQRNCEPR